MQNKNKKIIIGLLIAIIMMTSIGFGLLRPKKAKAFGMADVLAPAHYVVDAAGWVWEKMQPALEKAWKAATDVAYKNAFKYFLNRVAYDSATYIAAGGKGQGPLFQYKNMGEYLSDVSGEAAGVFFEELTKPNQRKIPGKCVYYGVDGPKKSCYKNEDCEFKKDPNDQMAYQGRCEGAIQEGEWSGLGINLCQPLDGQVKVDLTVAARRSLEPARPRCDWNDVKKNLNDAREMKLSDMVRFSTSFRPESNDLGAYLSIRTAQQEYVDRQEMNETLERVIGGPYKAVTTLVSDLTKTPAPLVQRASEKALEDATEAEKIQTGSPFADVISIFTNTLISKTLKQIFEKGYNPRASGGQFSGGDFWTSSGLAAAKLLFSELGEVDYNFNVGMNISELSMEGSGQFNDVIDPAFAQAIEQKCTLGQAVGYYSPGNDNYRADCIAGGQGLISGDAGFGYNQSGMPVDNKKGISFRSILVLRKFRVVPVGWELAAEYYKNYDTKKEKLTLNKLIQEYDNAKSSYYKLVDPNWVLKLPLTRCAKLGASEQIMEDTMIETCDIALVDDKCPEGHLTISFQRMDNCADYETCLDDSSGRCASDDWGYCLEEKPIWVIEGQECSQKYYATCEKLINQENRGTEYYILNTVSGRENGVCNNSNSGCRAYCLSLDVANNEWSCSAGSGQKRYYTFNEDEKCSQSEEGCGFVFSSLDQDVEEVQNAFDQKKEDSNAYGLLVGNYYKIAPDYYECDEYNQIISNITRETDCPSQNVWRDDIKRCVQGGSARCEDFVKECSAEDLNCELYTPLNTNDPEVSAVIEEKNCPDNDPYCNDENNLSIEWNDECPVSCVGYQTYTQMATDFEEVSSEDFIASTGQSCSQAKCDEFTNLAEVAQGGEGLEYYSYVRQCLKPSDGGWSTYYTWEGSDTEGYQLKRWELKEGPDGGPYYLSDGQCTDLNDDDCREFFDENYNAHKRYYSKTIVATDECEIYRRTFDQQDYKLYPAESQSCSAGNNLCREYKTGQGYNYENIVESYFDRQNDEGWQGNLEVSQESIKRDDYSLKVSGKIEHVLRAGDLKTDKLYSLEFLAKGSGSVTAKFNNGGSVVNSNITSGLTSNWQHYTLKLPNNLTGLNSTETDNRQIEISLNGYIDNIILKEMNSLLLIKDSWETPAICQVPSGNIDHLGCQAYKNPADEQINLRSFSKLCFDDVVGCELAIDTRQTILNKSDDRLKYLVLDKDVKCSAEEFGCTAMGLITPNRDDGSYNFETVYNIIDRSDGGQTCSVNEVYCTTYQDEDGNVYNLKDPLDKVCEYDEDSGMWYKKDGDDLCPVEDMTSFEKHCIGGVSMKSSDNTCDEDSDCINYAQPGEKGLCSAWVGECNNRSVGCREYQDPQSPEECDINLLNYEDKYNKNIGTFEVCDYYYYKDVEECKQGVNPNAGCVGFYQTDGPQRNIRSYKVCEEVAGKPACERDSECSPGRCVYTNVE